MGNEQDAPVRSSGTFVNFSGGELCLPPVSDPDLPSFIVPDGACDAHVHVFSDRSDYPLIPDRNYTPANVDDVDLLAMLARLGVARVVLVQPSVYGTDNTRLLSVLRAQGDRARGVVVIDQHVTADSLREMRDLGVRGIRVNLLYRGGVALASLASLAPRIAELGWHIQLLIRGETLPQISGALRDCAATLVFDHMAQMPLGDGFETAPFRHLDDHMGTGRCYIKLSGANRFAPDGQETPLIGQWRRILVARFPDRCVWGSDWPHVGVPTPINTGALFNAFARDIPDVGVRDHILRDNAARLYGFPVAAVPASTSGRGNEERTEATA